MLELLLDEERCAVLGRALGTLAASVPPPPLFLNGDLGAGKTTLTRHLVAALPGGHLAEVASPSFTLCNSYDTVPPVLHADLYRFGDAPQALPEVVEDALAGDGSWLILEWASFLPPALWPAARLDILLQPCERLRKVTLTAQGDQTRLWLERLAAMLPESWTAFA